MPIALSQKDKSCLTLITNKQERNGKRCGEGVVGLRLEGGCEKRGGAKGEGMEEMEKDGDTKINLEVSAWEVGQKNDYEHPLQPPFEILSLTRSRIY